VTGATENRVEIFIWMTSPEERVIMLIGRGVDTDVVCQRFCSTCTANTLIRKPFKGLETLY
jgi:hypothetical protein